MISLSLVLNVATVPNPLAASGNAGRVSARKSMVSSSVRA
jgi:hypothetical protein